MAELRAYDPTWREIIGGWISGDSNSYSPRAALARGLVGSSGLGNGMGLIDLAPVAGAAIGAQEAIHESAPQQDHSIQCTCWDGRRWRACEQRISR